MATNQPPMGKYHRPHSAFAIFASIPNSRRKNISSRCLSRFLMSSFTTLYPTLYTRIRFDNNYSVGSGDKSYIDDAGRRAWLQHNPERQIDDDRKAGQEQRYYHYDPAHPHYVKIKTAARFTRTRLQSPFHR